MASTKRSNKGQQSAAARARRQEKAQAAAEAKEAKERRKSLGIKIAAAVFALLMGLSMLLPSLSYFFSNSQTEAQTMSNVSVSGATTVEEVDAAFSSVVDELEEKLERSGDNAKVLVRLGNDYMNCIVC